MKRYVHILFMFTSVGVGFVNDLMSQNVSSFYKDFNTGQNSQSMEEWIKTIQIISPACCSEIKGAVVVKFKALGMEQAKAFCWQQPTDENSNEWGHDVDLTPKPLNVGENEISEFSFNADDFPAGPMNVRIFSKNSKGQRDVFELQLYNLGGVRWKIGIPKDAPPASKGLKLVFYDDFCGDLSISNDGRNARYSSHKPRFGDFSGWPFADPNGLGNPFEQVDSFLKIKA